MWVAKLCFFQFCGSPISKSREPLIDIIDVLRQRPLEVAEFFEGMVFQFFCVKPSSKLNAK